MDNTVYLYIPREKLLNSISRKHRNKKFKKLYYYKKNKKQQLIKKINYNNRIKMKLNPENFLLDWS